MHCCGPLHAPPPPTHPPFGNHWNVIVFVFWESQFVRYSQVEHLQAVAVVSCKLIFFFFEESGDSSSLYVTRSGQENSGIYRFGEKVIKPSNQNKGTFDETDVDSLRTEGKSKRQMITVLVCRATLCGVDVQQEERRPLTEQSLRLLQGEKLWKPPTELHVDSVCHSGLHGKNRMTSTHHMSTALTLSYCPLITYCVVPRQMLAAPRANCSGNGHPRWMPSSSVETQTPSSRFLSW